MAIFAPPIAPQEGADGTHRHRSRSIKFGDGYLAIAGEGINTKEESWSVTYRGTDAEINPIKEFLDVHGTHLSFTWTPPNGVTGNFLALDGYKESPSSAGNNQLSVTLYRRYFP